MYFLHIQYYSVFTLKLLPLVQFCIRCKLMMDREETQARGLFCVSFYHLDSFDTHTISFTNRNENTFLGQTIAYLPPQ